MGETSGLHHILRSQQADGSFSTSARLDRLFAAMWKDVAACRKAIAAELSSAGAPAARLKALVRAVMALLVLEGQLSGSRRQWNRAYRKAVEYIATAMGISTAEVQWILSELHARLLSDAS